MFSEVVSECFHGFPMISIEFQHFPRCSSVFLGETSSTATVPGAVLLLRLGVFLGRRLIDLQQDLQCSVDDGGVDDILPITGIYSYCNGILWDNAWDIWDNMVNHQ